MKIEVKNVKYMASMSEETLCYTATVYADGKKFATASNRGFGGETDIDYDHSQKAVYFAARDYVATLPDAVTEWGGYEQSLESFVDDLVADWLTMRELKSKLKKKWLFTVKGKDGLYGIKRSPSPASALSLAAASINLHLTSAHGKGGYTLLNTLPLDEAVKLYSPSNSGSKSG